MSKNLNEADKTTNTIQQTNEEAVKQQNGTETGKVLDALDRDILAAQAEKEAERERVIQQNSTESTDLMESIRKVEVEKVEVEKSELQTVEQAEEVEQEEEGEQVVIETDDTAILSGQRHTIMDMAYVKYIISGLGAIVLIIIVLTIVSCKNSETAYKEFYAEKLLSTIVVDSEKGTGFIDSDNDRLIDTKEEEIGTDKNKADTDDDGVMDGVEVYYGFDPVVYNNFEKGVEIVSTTEDCKVVVTGDKDVFDLRLAKIDSASMRGTLGIVSNIYSIVDLKGQAHIDIANIPSDCNAALARYNVDKFSVVNCVQTENSISADITESGVYCVIDTTKYAPEAGYDIMFLIDNSGSMYPEEYCANSDESDVDFKRVDFVEQFISKYEGVDTKYAVATFTGDYNLLYDYTTAKGPIVGGLNMVKEPANMPYFNGTDIENALTNVLNNVDKDRRNIIVLITDGMNTNKITHITQDDVLKQCSENNATIIAVALGNQVDKDALMYYVTNSHGVYTHLSNADEFDNAIVLLQNYLDQTKHKVEFSKLLDDVEPDNTFDALSTADSYFNKDRDTFNVNWLNVDGIDMTRGYAVFISQYKAGKLSWDNTVNIAKLFEKDMFEQYRTYTKDKQPWQSFETTTSLKEEYKGIKGLKVVSAEYADDEFVWSGWASILNVINKDKKVQNFEYLTIDSASLDNVQLQQVLANIANFNTNVSEALVSRSQLLNCAISLKEGIPVPTESRYGTGLITKMYQDVNDGTIFAVQFYSFKYDKNFNIRVRDCYGDLIYDSPEDFLNLIVVE